MVASIEIKSDYDVRKILRLAECQDAELARVYGSRLEVQGVSQEALNTAILTYNHDETISAILRYEWKSIREKSVERIKVTTQAGNTFDGDEISQGRMSRSISCMNDGDSVRWVLADNSLINATINELKEALRLAGAAQASIWVTDNSKDAGP